MQLVHTKCKFVTLILKVNAMQPQTAHPKKLEMSLLVKTGTFCEWLPNRHSCISTWAKKQVMGGGGGEATQGGREGEVEEDRWVESE